MTTIHALTHLEALLNAATRIYAFASEIFTISALIWGFNFFCDLTDRTWHFGYSVGTFYRTHMHAFCKKVVTRIVAAIILVSQLTFEAGHHVYANRGDYLDSANALRNQIGSWFAYESPAAVADEAVEVFDVEVIDPRDYYAIEATTPEPASLFGLFSHYTVKELRGMAKGLATGVHKMRKDELILLVTAVD